MGESEAEFRFAMALPMVGLSVVLLVRHAGGLAAVSAALAFTFYFLGLMHKGKSRTSSSPCWKPG